MSDADQLSPTGPGTGTGTGTGGTSTTPEPSGDVDQLAVDALRFLTADAVQAAGSGHHTGLSLGTAPAAWVLWSRHLRHDPSNPDWPDRDRFVLSAGHGSMLLYGLLHVFGYDLPIEELRRFRQLGSRTPGHPEIGCTPGVETTTGPPGQGLANAVGMALAERMLASRCNNADHLVVDHRTWALVDDGCLMEGISHEAAALAGRLGLGKLTVVFGDDNDVTADGPAERSWADDVPSRFAAYGWRTLHVEDGDDVGALDRAFTRARSTDDCPTLIIVRGTVGFGVPGIEGTAKAHGNPPGHRPIAATQSRFGCPAATFHVPAAVRLAVVDGLADRAANRARWTGMHDRWMAARPRLAAEFPLDRVPAASDLSVLTDLAESAGGGATADRSASEAALHALAAAYPALVGGTADLASTPTAIGGDDAPGDFSGRTINFGMREHAMAAALNGIAIHGGLRPYGSTFLAFSDHLRPALRLSALMRLPVVYVFTHDSVHVGEDGPTHQPVEQIESLRLIPGLTVLRPADAAEEAMAWELAADRLDGPTALVLSRQDRPAFGASGLGEIRDHGARIVRRPAGIADVLLAASGSEVGLAAKAAELLAARGVEAVVMSVIWRERLDAALGSGAIVLPDVPAVWVEAGVPVGWRALARPRDAVIGLDRYGASGPGQEVAVHLGLSVTAVARKAMEVVGRTPVSAGALPGY